MIRAMFSPFELVAEKKKYNRQGILHAIDPVVNLATVNYILHGLQRFGFDKTDHKFWHTLWIALGIDHHFSGENSFKHRFCLQSFLTWQWEQYVAGCKKKSRSLLARRCLIGML